MKNLLVSLLTFVTLNTTLAQNPIPANYTNSEGETVNGYVWKIIKKYNPNKILFSKTLTEKPYEIKKDDILNLSFENYKFVKAIVDRQSSLRNVNYLEQNKEFKIVKDTVLLECFVEGEKSLYYYKSYTGIENFYIKENGSYQLLYFKKYISIQNGKRSIKSINKYRGQLFLYFNQSEKYRKVIENITYQKRKLIKLFNDYNKSIEQLVYVKKIPKIKNQVAIFGGLAYTKTKYIGSNSFLSEVNGALQPSLNFNFGMNYEVLIPKKKKYKNSLLIELQYVRFTAKEENKRSSISRFTDTENVIIYKSKIIKNNINLNLLYRYRIYGEKINYYFNTGFSVGKLLGYSSVLNTQILQNDVLISDKDEENYPNYNGFIDTGLLFGVGIEKGKFTLELRFDIGFYDTIYLNMNEKSNRIFLNLGYIL